MVTGQVTCAFLLFGYRVHHARAVLIMFRIFSNTTISRSLTGVLKRIIVKRRESS
jgi:hypothetical protein